MKVLLVLGHEYRTYMEAMADALQEFRPDVEVVAVGGDSQDLEVETERLKPHLVICSPPAPKNPVDERLALIELSPDSEQPSSFRVGERHWHSATLPSARYCLWSTRQKASSGHPASRTVDPPKIRKVRI